MPPSGCGAMASVRANVRPRSNPGRALSALTLANRGSLTTLSAMMHRFHPVPRPRAAGTRSILSKHAGRSGLARKRRCGQPGVPRCQRGGFPPCANRGGNGCMVFLTRTNHDAASPRGTPERDCPWPLKKTATSTLSLRGGVSAAARAERAAGAMPPPAAIGAAATAGA